ncbi:hypothetical protein CYLTODRAFT_424628 [Cylindrobasidium torrendii FP15055 ss-10]|uniref:Uncharacterized protein n=1 Tax=Cylindrobasidium torrendii FP15055 ss-10 TaxID=1314674 RepID=A0A0D7B3M4_9AGAR|nr:hypothetical protein CYLTODRAFT_424628 [Cylindrobasidium torrendii FP15055 ss-10]
MTARLKSLLSSMSASSPRRALCVHCCNSRCREDETLTESEGSNTVDMDWQMWSATIDTGLKSNIFKYMCMGNTFALEDEYARRLANEHTLKIDVQSAVPICDQVALLCIHHIELGCSPRCRVRSSDLANYQRRDKSCELDVVDDDEDDDAESTGHESTRSIEDDGVQPDLFQVKRPSKKKLRWNAWNNEDIDYWKSNWPQLEDKSSCSCFMNITQRRMRPPWTLQHARFAMARATRARWSPESEVDWM